MSTSKGTIDVLLETGWIKLRGRRRAPGRPVTYGTTAEFLEHFGFDSIQDLPGLNELKGAGLLDSNLPPGFTMPNPDDAPASARRRGAARGRLPRRRAARRGRRGRGRRRAHLIVSAWLRYAGGECLDLSDARVPQGARRRRNRRGKNGNRGTGRGKAAVTFAASLSLRERVAPLRRHPRARPGQPRHRAVGDPLPARAVGLRQVDPAQDRRRRRAPVFGARADRRPRGGGTQPLRAAGEARRRADVPGLRAVPASHHSRQCRLRLEIADAQRSQGRGLRRAGARGPQPLRRRIPAYPLRRRAAARGAGPRHRAAAERAV